MLTLTQLDNYINEAQRAYVNQGLVVLRSQKRGRKNFGELLTKNLLTSIFLSATKRYVPPGTVVVPAEPATAVFDLSFITDTLPNANDIRVSVVRLPATTIGDSYVDHQGSTAIQWIEQVASSIGGGYTGTVDGMELRVEESTPGTGDIRLTIYPHSTPALNTYYDYFDWASIDPSLVVSQKNGIKTPAGIILFYSLESAGIFYPILDDGQGQGYLSQILGLNQGITSIAVLSPWADGIKVYYSNTDTGLIEWINNFGSSGTYGSSVSPTSTKADAVYDPTTDYIYFITGGKYHKIRSDKTTFISTAVSMPDDDYLVRNVLIGTPLSYSVGGTVLTQYADSGALTTHTLSIAIAGRISIYDNSYYVPKSADRKIHIFNSSFVSTAVLDLALIVENTVTSNVQDTYVNGDKLFIVHVDNNVTVIDLLTFSFQNTFFTGVNALSFFDTYMEGETGVYLISGTPQYQVDEEIQGSGEEVVWTEDDNCLTDAEQIKLMGKVQRQWLGSCSISVSPVSQANYILTSAGQDLLTSNGIQVIE